MHLTLNKNILGNLQKNCVIVVNGKKTGILKANDKEKFIHLSDDSINTGYLMFLMFPVSNKKIISPGNDLSVAVSDHFITRVLGSLLSISFFIGLIPILKDGQDVSLWYFGDLIFVSFTGFYLEICKKVKI